ncbi:hypothetical protein Hanom_Chr16g01518181 [Helianthus anomalus]
MALTVRGDGRPLGLHLSENGGPATADPVLCDPLALNKHKELLPGPPGQPGSLAVEVFVGGEDDGGESQPVKRHT